MNHNIPVFRRDERLPNTINHFINGVDYEF
jgi:hypothetical protein